MSTQLFATVSVEQQEIVAGGGSPIVKFDEQAFFQELGVLKSGVSASRYGSKSFTVRINKINTGAEKALVTIG